MQQQLAGSRRQFLAVGALNKTPEPQQNSLLAGMRLPTHLGCHAAA